MSKELKEQIRLKWMYETEGISTSEGVDNAMQEYFLTKSIRMLKDLKPKIMSVESLFLIDEQIDNLQQQLSKLQGK